MYLGILQGSRVRRRLGLNLYFFVPSYLFIIPFHVSTCISLLAVSFVYHSDFGVVAHVEEAYRVIVILTSAHVRVEVIWC